MRTQVGCMLQGECIRGGGNDFARDFLGVKLLPNLWAHGPTFIKLQKKHNSNATTCVFMDHLCRWGCSHVSWRLATPSGSSVAESLFLYFASEMKVPRFWDASKHKITQMFDLVRATSHTRVRARDQLHFKHSRWWKRRSRSKFASHYAWGTNGVCECKMNV